MDNVYSNKYNKYNKYKSKYLDLKQHAGASKKEELEKLNKKILETYEQLISGHDVQPRKKEIIKDTDNYDAMITKFDLWYSNAKYAADDYDRNKPILGRVLDSTGLTQAYNPQKFDLLISQFIDNNQKLFYPYGSQKEDELLKNKFIKHIINKLVSPSPDIKKQDGILRRDRETPNNNIYDKSLDIHNNNYDKSINTQDIDADIVYNVYQPFFIELKFEIDYEKGMNNKQNNNLMYNSLQEWLREEYNNRPINEESFKNLINKIENFNATIKDTKILESDFYKSMVILLNYFIKKLNPNNNEDDIINKFNQLYEAVSSNKNYKQLLEKLKENLEKYYKESNDLYNLDTPFIKNILNKFNITAITTTVLE